MRKVLITSGCSFTYEDWNWQGHLSRKLNCKIINRGFPAQGNGLISRKLIYSVSESLKEYDNKEILIGVMWSGPDRHEFYSSNYRDSKSWAGMNDGRFENPTSVVPGNPNWYIMNYNWTNKESRIFYSEYHNNTSSLIITLEHILRTQMFLEKNGLNYFMSTYIDIFNNSEIMKNPEVNYLYNMIDFNKFLPVKGCHEWVKENYGGNGGFNDPDKNGYIGIHPTSFGHEKFVNEVILPHIKSKGI